MSTTRHKSRKANGHDTSRSALTLQATGAASAPQPAVPDAAPAAAAAGVNAVCVYCGSGIGRNPVYVRAAQTLGRSLAQSRISLVYGGGGNGLMGETARSVLKHGGTVTGIIPQFLSDKESMLRDVQELIVTDDMHQRKRLMFERSDAFVALPGGIGTLEELVEQLTWAQLGRHRKPIVLANIDGFWNPLLALLSHMRDEAFIRAGLEVRFVTVDKAKDIVPAILRTASPGASDDARVKALVTQF
ncbi:MAG: TIGR00730 family Rossman fold protein [Hyphomicrobiales bacterium]|nr:TIGR00730 family Rossman fold protein [Hyphomicrobiales bacterium]